MVDVCPYWTHLCLAKRSRQPSSFGYPLTTSIPPAESTSKPHTQTQHIYENWQHWRIYNPCVFLFIEYFFCDFEHKAWIRLQSLYVNALLLTVLHHYNTECYYSSPLAAVTTQWQLVALWVISFRFPRSPCGLDCQPL